MAQQFWWSKQRQGGIWHATLEDKRRTLCGRTASFGGYGFYETRYTLNFTRCKQCAERLEAANDEDHEPDKENYLHDVFDNSRKSE